jgi:hypothetical protein
VYCPLFYFWRRFQVGSNRTLRFYLAELVDIDESDYSSLIEIIDHNDQFVPFVLAYARRALIEAKEGFEKVDRKKKIQFAEQFTITF